MHLIVIRRIARQKATMIVMAMRGAWSFFQIIAVVILFVIAFLFLLSRFNSFNHPVISFFNFSFALHQLVLRFHEGSFIGFINIRQAVAEFFQLGLFLVL